MEDEFDGSEPTDRKAVPDYFFRARFAAPPGGTLAKRIAPIIFDWRNGLRDSVRQVPDYLTVMRQGVRGLRMGIDAAWENVMWNPPRSARPRRRAFSEIE